MTARSNCRLSFRHAPRLIGLIASLGLPACGWAAGASGGAPGSSVAAAIPAPAAPAPDVLEAKAPAAMIDLACFSNGCGDQTAAKPRDGAAVEAAIKAGDGKTVLAAGGDASDLLAAWMNQIDARGGVKRDAGWIDVSGQTVRDQMAPGSEQFALIDGRTAVHYDLTDGGHETLSFPEAWSFKLPDGTPDARTLDGLRAGSTIAQPGTSPISAPVAGSTTARQILGYYSPPASP